MLKRRRPASPKPQRSPLAADLSAARSQGWQIEVLDHETLRLTHARAGTLIVDSTRTGEHTRRRLRRAMDAIAEGEPLAP